MTRIDSNVAVQIADTVRPAQTSQDRSLQSRQAAATDVVDGGTKSVRADDVRAAVAAIKQVVESASGRSLGFEVHEREGDQSGGELVLTVTDMTTGEVVKQIPGDEVLRMRDRLHEMIGMFINKDA